VTLVYPPHDFEAYLTAVLATWHNRAPEWPIVAEGGGWFGPEGPCRRVDGDVRAAQRVATGIRNLAGRRAWIALGWAFRHSGPRKESLLAEFIRSCVKYGPSTLDRLTDAGVVETLVRARAVKAEAHRYLGLLRFQTVDGQGWYAAYEPDHDVTGLLVGPFHRRMEGLDWMIHDVGRGKAWVCQNGAGRGVTGVVVSSVPSGEVHEASYQALWRQYFQTIAVRERLNPRCQRSKMPVKTWNHLVERPQTG